MNITRTSPFTGKQTTLDLDVTLEQLKEMDSPNRRKIQHIFPNLTVNDREFIKTGYTSEDWITLFGNDDDD